MIFQNNIICITLYFEVYINYIEINEYKISFCIHFYIKLKCELLDHDKIR